MAKTYRAYNGASPTTAGIVKVATGTSIKTLLQIATPSTKRIRAVEWGISFDGSAAATPVLVELIETDVAATVTAHVAAGIIPINDSSAPASLVTLGTAATGYTASAEGSITSTRLIDAQLIAPTNQYVKQLPLGREGEIGVSKFLRIRVTAPATVNVLCYIEWEE